MNTKLSAVIQIVMFYVAFMAPFVLKNSLDSGVRVSNAPGRRLDHEKSEAMFWLTVLGCFVFGIIGWAMMAAATPGGVLLGALFLVVAGGIAFFGFRKTIKLYLKNERSSRRLSLDQSQELTEKDQEKIREKTRKYGNNFEKKLNLGKLYQDAGKVTITTRAIKLMKTVRPQKTKLVTGLTFDQMKIELRNRYDYELFALEDMEKEMKNFSTMSDVEVWHGPQKIRRKYWKRKLEGAIDFIQQEFYDRKKWEQSWEYKLQWHGATLGPKLKELESKKITPERRKELENEIKLFIERDDASVSQEYRDQRDLELIISYYKLGGVSEYDSHTTFFISYRRAALVTLMKIEKIELTKHGVTTNLDPESREKLDKGIKEINRQISFMESGNDLK